MNSIWGMLTILGVAALAAGALVAFAAVHNWRREQASPHMDEEYRKLAAQYAEALRKSTEEQEKLRSELAQIREHLAAIEKLLREVE